MSLCQSSIMWVVMGRVLCQAAGLQCLCAGPSWVAELDREGKTLLHNPSVLPPPPPNPAILNGSIVAADLLSSSCTLSFFSFSQHIMTPDYVTTGIVSDWADCIEIKDEDLIQRQLQVSLRCHWVQLYLISNIFARMFAHVCVCCFTVYEITFYLLILCVVSRCCKQHTRWSQLIKSNFCPEQGFNYGIRPVIWCIRAFTCRAVQIIIMIYL